MVGTSRPLTEAERALAASVFGGAIDYDPVRIFKRKWFPFQPRQTAMAPMGHIHFHPGGNLWSEDFATDLPWRQALFIHEMTHVLQAQERGRFYLPLMRHPFCQYSYAIRPGWPLKRYGLEQQAEIVKHVFMLRNGHSFPGAPPLAQLEGILPFNPQAS